MRMRTRWWIDSARRSRALTATLGVVILGPMVQAQTPPPFAVALDCATVVDPKLGAPVPITVFVPSSSGPVDVAVRIDHQGAPLAKLWGTTVAGDRELRFDWNGRLPATVAPSQPCVDPGTYELVATAIERATGRTATTSRPLHVVRLGIREIAALGPTPNTEWQLVYFKRGTYAGTQFYATPSIGEYRNIADTGEIADLDLNDGSPRTPVPVHTATASPPLEGASYENDRFNFPVCYRAGVQPLFAVRFGTTAVAANGQAVGANYPVPGVSLRCVAAGDGGAWQAYATDIAPNGIGAFLGPALPAHAGATDFAVFWSFEWSTDGGANWFAVPGRIRTEHRVYTVLGIPRFGSATGVQHSGPWVEVLANLETWRQALGIDTTTAAGVAEVLTKGFGGQVPGVPLPIENVRYDTNILGGDGGASHYYVSGHAVRLSYLLDNARSGWFVNCSDCASSLSAMMGMAGLQSVQMQRLGPMNLRAIRGIGAPSYTLALWGTSHGFSYHHVVTRAAGASVCDACLWVDEDGAPMSLPGAPGYNHDRAWSGSATSYQSLVATGPITFTLESLPSLQ